MGPEILIPAAVGAVGSAATGRSPITGALLGGALGGVGSSLFSGAAGSAAQGATAAQGAGTGLFGSTEAISPFTPTGVLGTQTATSALSGMQPTLGMAGEQFAAQNAPLYTGSTGMFDVGGTQNQILGGIGQSTAAAGGGYDPSLWGSVKRGAESGYNTLADWTKANPMQALSTTGQLVQAVSPQEQAQQMMQQQALPITKGTYNVAPSPVTQPGDKVASKMQITPNQLQVYPNFYFRGGY